MGNVPNPDYDPFAGNPIIDEAEKALRAFEGEPLTRAQAEKLLSMWAHNTELTDRERTAVLDRFGPAPETPAADDVLDREIVDALKRIDERLNATSNPQVYELGIKEGLRRALAEADLRERKAYARGYVEAMSVRLDCTPVLRFGDDGSTSLTDHERALEYRAHLRENATHAWVVRRDDVPGTFVWTCACGMTVLQDRDESDIRSKLRAHIERREHSEV